jgi:hypothetical protein
MPSFSGFYKAKRNARTYTFTASWRPAGEGAIWHGEVRLNGEVVGHADGQIRHTRGLEKELERIVGQEVESAIEERLGVD